MPNARSSKERIERMSEAVSFVNRYLLMTFRSLERYTISNEKSTVPFDRRMSVMKLVRYAFTLTLQSTKVTSSRRISIGAVGEVVQLIGGDRCSRNQRRTRISRSIYLTFLPPPFTRFRFDPRRKINHFDLNICTSYAQHIMTDK